MPPVPGGACEDGQLTAAKPTVHSAQSIVSCSQGATAQQAQPAFKITAYSDSEAGNFRVGLATRNFVNVWSMDHQLLSMTTKLFKLKLNPCTNMGVFVQVYIYPSKWFTVHVKRSNPSNRRAETDFFTQNFVNNVESVSWR